MGKLIVAIIIAYIIFKSAFQENARPGIWLMLGGLVFVMGVIVFLQILFGDKK